MAEESGAFADSIVTGGPPMARIVRQGVDGRKIWAEWESPIPIVAVSFNYTTDNGVWQKRLWQIRSIPVDAKEHRIEADIPEDATACFLNLLDARNLVVSSELQTIPPVSSP